MLGCLIDVIIKITNSNVRMDDNGDAHVHVIYADCADSGLAILYSCILSFGYMWANYKVHLTSRFLLKSLKMTRRLGQTLASVNSHEFGNDFGPHLKLCVMDPVVTCCFVDFEVIFLVIRLKLLWWCLTSVSGFAELELKYHYIETILTIILKQFWIFIFKHSGRLVESISVSKWSRCSYFLC